MEDMAVVGSPKLFLAVLLPKTRDVIRQHELVQESWRARFHRPERVLQVLEHKRVRDPPPRINVFSRFDQTRCSLHTTVEMR